jgi:hypothetical protein
MLNQRWINGRNTWAPASPIKTWLYEVASIEGDTSPKRFVCQHHYSGSYPAARFRFGLYRGGQLHGVAIFSHPCNDSVLTSVLPGTALESVELGRFVLLDEVPGNGETWFLARCFEQLRQADLVGVVSFSDPVPRSTAAGDVVFPGHVGTIYQAHNAVYLGRGTPRSLRILPDGRVLSDRTISKLRKRERGWQYAVELLQQHGADAPGADLAAWTRHWVGKLTRGVRHPGNHKYAWPLNQRVRRHLPASLAYPKIQAA